MSEWEDEATNPEVTKDLSGGHHESILENDHATSEVQFESATQTDEAPNDNPTDGDAEVKSTNICPTFLTSGETGHDIMAEQSSTKVVSVTSDVGNSTASGEIDTSCYPFSDKIVGPCQGHAHSHCNSNL